MRKTMLATTILMAALAAPVHAQVAEAPADTPAIPQQATVGADGIRTEATVIVAVAETPEANAGRCFLAVVASIVSVTG